MVNRQPLAINAIVEGRSDQNHPRRQLIWHRQLGLWLTVVLAHFCLSALPSLFPHAIAQWANPQWRASAEWRSDSEQSASTAQRTEQQLALLQQQQPKLDGRFYLAGAHEPQTRVVFSNQQQWRMVNGQAVQGHNPLADTLVRWHRQWLLPGLLGKTLTGICGLLLLFCLALGLRSHWQWRRSLAHWRNNTALLVRHSNTASDHAKRHKWLGLLSLPGLAVLSFTGTALGLFFLLLLLAIPSYHGDRQQAMAELLGEPANGKNTVLHATHTLSPSTDLAWQHALDISQRALPGFQPEQVQLHFVRQPSPSALPEPSAPATAAQFEINGGMTGQWASLQSVHLLAGANQVDYVRDLSDSFAGAWLGALVPLHFAEYWQPRSEQDWWTELGNLAVQSGYALLALLGWALARHGAALAVQRQASAIRLALWCLIDGEALAIATLLALAPWQALAVWPSPSTLLLLLLVFYSAALWLLRRNNINTAPMLATTTIILASLALFGDWQHHGGLYTSMAQGQWRVVALQCGWLLGATLATIALRQARTRANATASPHPNISAEPKGLTD